MADLRVALPYLCRMEPGATAERAMVRIADVTDVGQVRAMARQLVAEGVLEPLGDGWAVVPEPDPTEQVALLRAALATVVAEPDPEKMTRIAQRALDETERGRSL